MTKQTLRPRGAGELIGQSLSLLFGNFGKLILIHLVFWVPVSLLVGLLVAGGVAAGSPVLVLVSVLIAVIVSPIPNAASIVAIADEFTGRSTPVGACFGTAFRRLGPLIGVGLVTGFLIMLGFVFLIIPGIYLMLRWFVSTQACLLENEGVSGSMGRSTELTKGSKGEILGVLIVMMLIGYAVFIPFALWQAAVDRSGSDGALLVSSLVDMIGRTVFSLLVACAGVAIYFNQRVKKDSFDLEALTGLVDEIGRQGAGATAT